MNRIEQLRTLVSAINESIAAGHIEDSTLKFKISEYRANALLDMIDLIYNPTVRVMSEDTAQCMECGACFKRENDGYTEECHVCKTELFIPGTPD